ncbi:MAG TPA: group 1 truncated hemoglobin [Planctomycetaceae bacterium]|jgi:hemoglobin|nr:group 1 truncated hemoglobin [Planctomycetaceae bacterium]
MVKPQALAPQRASLYERLGGYDAISATARNLLPRLQGDPQLGRFWAHRGADGILREQQLLIDFLCQSAGGPLYYRGRDMVTTHRGMRISSSDWDLFLGHLRDTLNDLQVPAAEQQDVLNFIESTRGDIVEA